ncbi:hypothetical protein C6496_10995 [Candidatus Poribacteria bacterium]|nr:MAG: hypothetical protein C6496_10995 [Candidatus Poribacteria bacterium]
MKQIVVTTALCLFITAGLPRFFALESHWSSDETLWLNRSEQFMLCVKHGRFSETLITHHPGVMTMWIAGIRTFFLQPRVDVENLALARFFIGIVVWIGLGTTFLLIYRLFGQWIALTSFASLVFSPLFLAQARRVHTDALATTFILLTVLLFLHYLQNRKHLHYLIFSGIAFGFALMSKSYALILLPWMPLCLFIFRKEDAENFRTFFVEMICFLNCTTLTVLVLWPIFWTPSFFLMALCLFWLTWHLCHRKKNRDCFTGFIVAATAGLGLVSASAIKIAWRFFDGVHWAITTPHGLEHFFFGKITHDPGWFFYPVVLMIKSTPLLLPVAFLGCFLLWRQRKCSAEAARLFFMALTLFAVVLLFMLFLSATSKKLSRYLLPIFPILEILASIGFVEGLRWSFVGLGSQFGIQKINTFKAALAVIACVFYFGIQIVPVLVCHPYYGTYYNICWKLTDITKIITVGEASGLDVASKYLDKKDNADQLRVAVSPLGTRFVQHYFVGFTYNTKKKYLPADYEIVYIRDSQIGKVPQIGTRNGVLEHIISLNGIDLAWIYRIPHKATP